MNGKSFAWLIAFAWLSNVGFAGTDVGYELNTSRLEPPTAASVGDAAIEFEDRVWAVPGVQQLVPKSDLVVAPWSASGLRLELNTMRDSYEMPRYAVRLPQWVDEIIWPLTRELWGGMSDLPAGTRPDLRLGRLNGMVLATQH